MCGHVGIAGKLEFKDEATLKRLLLLDYFRGMDSTGLASIRKNDEVFVSKMASHPIDLFDTKSYEKASNAYQSKVFLGHNRSATRGKVNGANAHPYQYGHIVGAHNGTLDTTSWKELNKVLGYETDTDSMAVFACIEKIGIEETVKLMSGAWALVWVNLEDGTLNFLRNKERPFWFSYTDDFSKLFWASEWPMIQAATEMAGKDVYELYNNEGGYAYFHTEEDYHYFVDMNKLNSCEYKSPPLTRGKKLEGKAPTPVKYLPQGSPFHGGTQSGSSTTGGTGSGTSTSTKATVPFITIVTTAEKPLGSFVTKQEFMDMSQGKCCYCSEPIEMADEGLVIFESMGEILCSDCSGHSTTRLMALPKTYHEYLTLKEKN
jgi:predicted glutamine amidotransferase